MEQNKIAADLSQDEANEQREAPKGSEIRTLSELELVLAGGGDGHINW